jgi:hypothetical protein
LEDIDINEKIILKWVLKEYGLRMWTGLNFLRIRRIAAALNITVNVKFHENT